MMPASGFVSVPTLCHMLPYVHVVTVTIQPFDFSSSFMFILRTGQCRHPTCPKLMADFSCH